MQVMQAVARRRPSPAVLEPQLKRMGLSATSGLTAVLTLPCMRAAVPFASELGRKGVAMVFTGVRHFRH